MPVRQWQQICEEFVINELMWGVYEPVYCLSKADK